MRDSLPSCTLSIITVTEQGEPLLLKSNMRYPLEFLLFLISLEEPSEPDSGSQIISTLIVISPNNSF